MAIYIHAKMDRKANMGHRRHGHISGVVGKEASDHGRFKRLGRNGGKHYVRFVDGLRTRFRQALDASTAGFLKRRGFRTAERLFRHLDQRFGGSVGTTFPSGKWIKRRNNSVGDKTRIRI